MSTPHSTRPLLIPQITKIIVSHLQNPADLKSISLVCQSFNAAVRPYLFRRLVFPRFEVSTPDPLKPLAYPLSPDYTPDENPDIDYSFTGLARSLTIPRDIAATHILSVGNLPRAREIARYKLESLPVYRAIRWYLKRTPLLDHFESIGVPRLVHQFLLLWESVPTIRSIKMEARGNIREEQILDTAGATLAQDRPEFLESPDWSTFGTRTYNIPEARLTFPHLTILALHGLPFDETARHFISLPKSSFRLRELVLVLKGAPHLSCLELSARVSGTGRPRGAIIQELCRNYLHAGGRALQKLRYIKLGKGFELYFPRGSGYLYNHPAGFLRNLFDFSQLEELHLLYDDYVDGPYLIEAHHPKDFIGINLAFNTHLARKLIHPGQLPSLRKLTLPWADGYTWDMIYYDSKFTMKRNLVINFVDQWHLQDQHRPRDGRHPYSYLWRVHTLLRPFPLSGLLLPTNGMSLPEQNLSHLVSLTTLKSLKTILPPLCDFGFFCATHDTTHLICDPRESSSSMNIHTITWQLRRLRNLRELWLAGDSRHKSYICIVQHIRARHSARIEHLAMAFIQRFRKLEYIRILDRAWRIATRDDADDKGNDNEEKVGEKEEKGGYTTSSDDDLGGEERTEAVARELSPWEVENDVPDAFDYRTPSLFRL